MFHVLIVNNPYQPTRGTDRFHVQHKGRQWTIRDWLVSQFGAGFEDFEQPTLCQVNGDYVLFLDWDTRELNNGDVLTFVKLPGDVVTAIIYIVVAIVVSVAVTLLLSDPVTPGESQEQSDPVYNLKGQSNRLRLGEPIETTYGRNRIWPSYAAPPYNFYEDNEQFQFSLFASVKVLTKSTTFTLKTRRFLRLTT